MADMGETYDAIILGAGHNGLILQAYLGKAGLKQCSAARLTGDPGRSNVSSVLFSRKAARMSTLKKQRVIFEIYPDSYEMLLDITRRFELADASKALRCLLDYTATEGDWDRIFKKVRCRRCV